MAIDNILKTAWIRQLKADWKTANYQYFKDSMCLPNLELSNADGVLDRWKGDPRLKEFYRRRNPKLARSSSRYTSRCQDTYNSGIIRGKNLVIHKGIHGKGKGEVKFLS